MGVKKFDNGTWGYDLRDPVGKRIRKSGFKTKSDADNAVTVLKSRWMSTKHGIPFKSDGLRLYASDELKRVAARHREAAVDFWSSANRFRAIKLEEFAASLPADLQLTRLSERHIDALREAETKRGIAPDTVNMYLRYLKKALHEIKRRNPELLGDWEVPKFNYISTPFKTRTKLITESELDKILAVLEDPPREANLLLRGYRTWKDSADFLRIAMMTGMRRAELLSMEWNQVYFDFRVLRVRSLKRKNSDHRRMREVPMTDEVFEIFRRRYEKRENEFVFPRWKSDPRSKWLYRSLAAACRFAGVPYGRGLADGVLPHSARHTAASRMLHNGVDLSTAAELLGHAPETLLKKYAHSTFDSKLDAVRGLSLNGR